MPSRRAFIAAFAVAFVPGTRLAAVRSQRRDPTPVRVTLVIDGMT